ncbi:MAG: hypothetical protein B6226_00605 [Candidatus Cloacimonetes bacterium 4572_65]|nr:MAG: hypothetical protein B6226_00605 [Candidatus Cloacimonetes bacterium 4572_65]
MKRIIFTSLLALAILSIVAAEYLSDEFGIDTVDPTISLTAPNGGNTFSAGHDFAITWSADDSNFGLSAVTIELSENNGEAFSMVSATEVNDGHFTWEIPNVATTEGVIKVTATDAFGNSSSDVSDSNFTIEDITLPVEFSGFTASQTSSDFVSLSWFTHSESSLIGYNIYRSDNSNLSNGLRINSTIISATNSTIGGTYSLADREVELNNSYYYWVEVVEISGDVNYHGPTEISLVGEAVEEAPALTTLYSAYPNPFNPTTTIKFSVKESDNASLVIANIKGQIIKSYPTFNTGEHTIIWNGKDNKGNSVSSGFYFYKLKSETTRQIRKMLLLK